MADLADTIRNIPLFSGLSREDIAKIMGYLVEVECTAGHKIFSQGDQGDALYLIQSGAVDVRVDSGGGRSETIAVLGPQEYFGEMALLSSAPRSATMIAVKDCRLWKLSCESWDDLIAKHATWLLHFCAVLSQRLSEMDRQYSQGRHAFDSLADEFYRKQPPAVQQFYRHAALLTTLDPRAVGARLQTDAAGSYLTALEASQLPLIRRANNDDYELHGFFREFLSERLLETEGAESKVGLHVAFAARYQALGDWPSAVEQSLAAKDWANAGRTLIAHKDEVSESRLRFVKDCLGRLPADAFYSDVGLVHLQVDTLCRLGDSAGALRCLKDALARREAVLGAATVERYHHAADRMFARTDRAQALTYLRNALNLAAQQESVRSGHSESEVERAHGPVTVAARDQSSLPGQSWLARFAGAREKLAISSWLGGVLVGLLAPLVVPFSETPALAMIVIALITYAVKLVFTSFLTVVTLVIALLPLAGDLQINPWIMIMIVLVASEVWFFPFQVDWHTLAYATTDGKGFSYHDMKRIRLFYAAAYLIALVAAIPYWRYLGLMR